MEREKLDLIEEIIDIKNEEYLNALYEVIIMGDYDYIENLFRTKEDFKEFIEKYKEDKND